jgi:diguanylate cyclase (GGDEF)-like protein
MRIYVEKYRLLYGLGAVLTIGFALTSATAYIAARDTLRNNFSQRTMPLMADNLHAEIRNTLSRPLLASSLIAQDSTVRDWIVNGETDPAQIVRYLTEINQRYDVTAGFVVSDRTRQTYHIDGSVKPVLDAEPRDKWLAKLRESKDPFQVRVERAAGTAFVHHRILDPGGNFIGATGVSLKLDGVTRLLTQYQTGSQSSVYLVDAAGATVLSGKPARQGALQERAGVRDIAAAILKQTSPQGQFEYQLDQETTLVHVRLIPELGLRLVAEQNLGAELGTVQPVLWLNLAIGAAVTLLVLALALTAQNRNQRRLEHIASTDPLTGLMNRQAFEIILRQSMRDFARNGRPMSLILFDIDMLKHINDEYGLQAGDEVLRAVAEVTKAVVRDNDIVTRWGGEEFLIFLRDCELDVAARLADKLRSAIAGYDFGLPMDSHQVTASVGVAQYLLQEPEERFFARADQARYEAKASGRNRTIVSIMEGQDTHEPLVSKRA